MVTKRRDVIDLIKTAAKSAHLDFSVEEGGSHTVCKLDGLKIPIPRHNEIDKFLVDKIYKECEPKLGRRWWK